MAEVFVSPGVYVRERDFSYYVSSVGESALALIGETAKGQAMRPTLIKNMSDFREKFGDFNPNKLIAYCADSYFKYANQAYIVRVLGGDSLRTTANANVLLALSNTASTTLATFLGPAGASIRVTGATANVSADTNFYVEMPGYSGQINLTNASSPVYVESMIPRNQAVTTGSCALQHLFKKQAALKTIATGAANTGTVIAAGSSLGISGYTNARTPVIVGAVANNTSHARQLFTLYSIGDGEAANTDIKIGIENIDTASSLFDIVVRQYGDSNGNQVVYERFKVNLDHTSDNYILKMIGDSRDETGDYTLVSKYIYADVVDESLTGLVPWGYEGIYTPANTEITSWPEWAYTTAYTTTSTIKRQYLGLDYDNTDPDALMAGHSTAWDLSVSSSTTNKGFHLDSGASATYYNKTASGTSQFTKDTAKFLVPILGGCDGWFNSATTKNLLSGTPSATDQQKWQAAIDTLRNPEEYDINLIAVPGVALNSAIGTYALQLAEERADCLYVGDMPSNITSATAAAGVTGPMNSNYACTYWPYVKIYDSVNKRDVWMPPTPQALEAIAYTDSVSYPWFAPAGMNRGLLTNVIRTRYKLTQDDRDVVYDAKCNPIVTWPGQGIAIWGQKTLQTRTTALDRINVRRMMLYIKKVIAGASLYLNFEQNDSTTWDRFKAMVQPILDIVKIQRGLVDFRVIMDETTNTPEMIERNQMVGQIYVKPTKTAEAILINFNLLAQGATFDD